MKSFKSSDILAIGAFLLFLAVLGYLAMPGAVNGFKRGAPMTAALNNARKLQVASMKLMRDTEQNAAGLTPGVEGKQLRVQTLAEYGSNLVKGGYLSETGLVKLLSAEGVKARYPVSQDFSAFKIYPVGSADATNTIFITTRNWTPYLSLDPESRPFGSKGFIVIKVGGDGAIYQGKYATNSNITGVLTTNAGGVPLK